MIKKKRDWNTRYIVNGYFTFKCYWISFLSWFHKLKIIQLLQKKSIRTIYNCKIINAVNMTEWTGFECSFDMWFWTLLDYYFNCSNGNEYWCITLFSPFEQWTILILGSSIVWKHYIFKRTFKILLTCLHVLSWSDLDFPHCQPISIDI